MSNDGSFEDDQDGCHVVAANTRHGVGSYESFQEILDNLLDFILLKFLFYDIYDPLVVLHIILPNTIASQ